jgi:hypothetical protein
VDPHGSLEESWFGLRVDVTPGVWDRSQPVVLLDQPARALAAEDLLLHLSVHLVFHLLMGKPSLVQLYDIGLVSASLPVAWDQLSRRARACRAIPFLYASLHLASAVFAAPVPPEVLTQLRAQTPRRLARRIERMGIDDVMQLTQRPPLVTIPQRLARGVSDRWATAAWASGLSGKWAVWRTAVDIGRTDTGKLIGARLRAGSQSGQPATRRG